MLESNRVKSSHIYLLSFIQPTIVFTTMFVGGWTTCLGIIIPLAVYPLLDVFFSVEKENFPVFHPPFYLEWIPALHVVFQLAILASLFVLIDNNDVTNISPVKRRIGMVFQSYALFPHLDVTSNLLLGLNFKKAN